MAKEHDDWMAKLGITIGGVRISNPQEPQPGLRTLDVQFHRRMNVKPKKFQIAGVPCFARPTFSIEIKGMVSARDSGGNWAVSGGVKATASGALEFGPGVASKQIMIGAYGSVGLHAAVPVEVGFDGAKPSGSCWSLKMPLVVTILGKGRIGVRAEDTARGRVDAGVDVADLELYIVTLDGWDGQSFKTVDVQDGRDMVKMKWAVENPSHAITDFVEAKASPELKARADAAVKWAAEGKGGHAMADATGAVLGGLGKVTGTQPTQAVPKAVGAVVDPGAGNPQEDADRAERRTEFDNDVGRSFWVLMSELGLAPGGALAPWRTAKEWNALLDLVKDDVARMEACQLPTDDWRNAARNLAEQARQRQQRNEADQAVAQQAIAAAELERALAEMTKTRTQAQGPMNLMDQRAPKDAAHPVRKILLKAWPHWHAAEQMQPRIKAAKGDAALELVKQARALYLQARDILKPGLPLVALKSQPAAVH